MRRVITLAREAADRGDHLVRSVLVRDDAIVAEASNRVVTGEGRAVHEAFGWSAPAPLPFSIPPPHPGNPFSPAGRFLAHER
jgi:hypothetical protein